MLLAGDCGREGERCQGLPGAGAAKGNGERRGERETQPPGSTVVEYSNASGDELPVHCCAHRLRYAKGLGSRGE